jgi:large subunit ribosomal protein L21
MFSITQCAIDAHHADHYNIAPQLERRPIFPAAISAELLPAVKREDWRHNLMYAIVRSGGRQYIAEPGKTIDVEKIAVDAGAAIELEVLLVAPDSGKTQVGTPLVKGAVVKATVVDHYRAKKILVWKYRPGLRFRKRRGHRQTYTRLRIDSIG